MLRFTPHCEKTTDTNNDHYYNCLSFATYKIKTQFHYVKRDVMLDNMILYLIIIKYYFIHLVHQLNGFPPAQKFTLEDLYLNKSWFED